VLCFRALHKSFFYVFRVLFSFDVSNPTPDSSKNVLVFLLNAKIGLFVRRLWVCSYFKPLLCMCLCVVAPFIWGALLLLCVWLWGVLVVVARSELP
jgi:hypothetical protein